MLVSFSKAYRLRARCVSSSRRIMSALRSAALTRVLGRIAGAGSASFAGPAALPAPCRLRSLLILLTSAIRTLLGIQRVQHLDDLIEHSLVPVKFIVDRGPIGPLNSGTARNARIKQGVVRLTQGPPSGPGVRLLLDVLRQQEQRRGAAGEVVHRLDRALHVSATRSRDDECDVGGI